MEGQSVAGIVTGSASDFVGLHSTLRLDLRARSDPAAKREGYTPLGGCEPGSLWRTRAGLLVNESLTEEARSQRDSDLFPDSVRSMSNLLGYSDSVQLPDLLHGKTGRFHGIIVENLSVVGVGFKFD